MSDIKTLPDGRIVQEMWGILLNGQILAVYALQSSATMKKGLSPGADVVRCQVVYKIKEETIDTAKAFADAPR